MTPSKRRPPVWAWALLAALPAACSAGEEPDNVTTFSSFPSGATTDPAETSGDGDPSTTEVPPDLPDEGETGDGDGDPTTGGDGDGDPTTSGDGDGDDPTTTGDGDGDPEFPPCTPDASCQTAPNIGSVSGDVNSGQLMAEGNKDAWFRFTVSEDNDNINGESLSVRIELSGPDGADYDLAVYRGNAAEASACGLNEMVSAGAGTDESLEYEWGEGGVANNSDDTRNFAVHVYNFEDVCDPGLEWALTIIGDTNPDD